MRTQAAALALTLLALPAAGQALRSADEPTQRSPAPGYSAFTSAPTTRGIPSEISLADRAGEPGDSGGPVNPNPFSGVPYTAFPHNGGQISPALRDTSAAWRSVPDLSK
jgi:hypothetical protein